MYVFLNQISFSYDQDGKNEQKHVKTVQVKQCPESFYKTEYEKKWYDLNKNNPLHCVDDDSIYLQGTRDSRVVG